MNPQPIFYCVLLSMYELNNFCWILFQAHLKLYSSVQSLIYTKEERQKVHEHISNVFYHLITAIKRYFEWKVTLLSTWSFFPHSLQKLKITQHLYFWIRSDYYQLNGMTKTFRWSIYFLLIHFTSLQKITNIYSLNKSFNRNIEFISVP